MVKKKTNVRKRSKKVVKTMVIAKTRRALDAKALEYARLLVDPCAAPLCHPVYPGGDSGFLFRVESVNTFANASGNNAGYVHWTPGYVNGSTTEMIAAGGAGSTTALINVTVPSNPGRQFLIDNASAVRCVAACMKITYPGSEQNRSGRIHYGHTQAGLIDFGDSITVDDLAPNLQHYGRTPPDTLELVWRPGIADVEFNDPSATASATIRDRKTSLTAAWAGLPNTIGMTVHFTAVYEWLPKTGKGLAANMAGKNTSTNTMDEVLDEINRYFPWVRGALHATTAAAGAFGRGVGQGAINTLFGTMATAYGLMPARQGAASRTRMLG